MYSVIVKPYESKHTNFIEIISDFQFWLITSSLIYFNEESKWSELAIYSIMGMLIFTSTIVVFVNF